MLTISVGQRAPAGWHLSTMHNWRTVTALVLLQNPLTAGQIGSAQLPGSTVIWGEPLAPIKQYDSHHWY
jgi:hypothetical protein